MNANANLTNFFFCRGDMYGETGLEWIQWYGSQVEAQPKLR